MRAHLWSISCLGLKELVQPVKINGGHFYLWKKNFEQFSSLTCPVCLYPCCLVCSGLCGLFRCWKRNTVFFGTLQLWISCGSQSCVSPYWCCSQSVFLKADACQSCSCPCCSRPGESCPSAFQYLKTKKGKSDSSVNLFILFCVCVCVCQ